MRASIRDFQSIKAVDVELVGLTVLVGPSNAGKSALVRALAGALFNRPGDSFVRQGAKVAEVTLTEVPVRDGDPLASVVWTKGAGVNQFVINGEKFSNVGKVAPQRLLDGGYRDLDIDDRVTLRPQVSGQFNGPFLLDASGSVVSEVLTRASRLDVLLRAGAACTKDLRGTRQTLGIRRADLTVAKRGLDLVEPRVTALQVRVQALCAREREVTALQTRVAQARHLWRRRLALRALVQAQLPASAVRPVLDLPATRLQALRAAVAKRARLVRARSIILPTRDYKDVAQAIKTGQVVVRGLRQWLPVRQRLVGLRACSLPPVAGRALDGAARAVQQISELRRLCAVQAASVQQQRTAEAAFAASTQELELANADVANLLHEAGVCPVCQQVVP